MHPNECALFTFPSFCASIRFMTTKPPDFTDINALAIEACDMWQEHLSSLASDPAARADLTRFLEPQRRLFADWAAMMQQGGIHAPPSSEKEEQPTSDEPAARADDAPRPTAAEPEPEPEPAADPVSVPPQSFAASVDDPLRVAQLALRLAELEKRVAQLESRADAFGLPPKPGAPRRA